MIDSAIFLRGDVNGSGTISMIDGILLLYRVAGLPQGGIGTCLDAEDINDSGVRDILDAAYLFQYLFAAGAPPPLPFGVCGDDPTGTDSFGCVSSLCP